MTPLPLVQLFLIVFLFIGVIKLSIHRVVVVCLPIFLQGLQVLILTLFSDFLLVVLLIIARYNIVVFLVIVDQVLLSLLG